MKTKNLEELKNEALDIFEFGTTEQDVCFSLASHIQTFCETIEERNCTIDGIQEYMDSFQKVKDLAENLKEGQVIAWYGVYNNPEIIKITE